jgi:hypothetical protein
LENLNSLNQLLTPYLSRQRNKVRLNGSSGSSSEQEYNLINEEISLENLVEVDFWGQGRVRTLFQESNSNPIEFYFFLYH